MLDLTLQIDTALNIGVRAIKLQVANLVNFFPADLTEIVQWR